MSWVDRCIGEGGKREKGKEGRDGGTEGGRMRMRRKRKIKRRGTRIRRGGGDGE